MFATLFWISALGWLTSYAPTDPEKEACYQAAAKSGRSTDECKTFWEKATSDPVALFTLVLALSTLGLWGATIGLYRAGNRQFRLARDEFVSSLRPEMRLKHIWFTRDLGDIWNGDPIELNLDVVNSGNGAGFVRQFAFETLLIPVGERLPQRPPYNEPGAFHFAINILLESGITVPRTVCDGRTLSPRDIADIRSGAVRLYFVGTIEYWDAASRARQTAFCRYLRCSNHPAPGANIVRIETEDDPEYEWKD